MFFAMEFYVYILYSEAFDRYYVGQTNDMTDRLRRHNSGYEFYTKRYIPWRLELSIVKETRGEAMVLERKLKNLSKERIRDFIAKYR